MAGFPKAGTTALANVLDCHSKIALTTPKEPSYYSWALNLPELQRENPNILGAQEYDAALNAARREASLVLDASTSYSHPGIIRETVKNMVQHRGHVKIVLLVRNPINRLYSDWNMRVVEGWADTSLKASIEQAAGGLVRMLKAEDRDGVLKEISHNDDWLGYISEDEPEKKHSLISHGFYDKLIEIYVDQFGDDVLIVPQEMLRDDPAELIRVVCSHIGVENEPIQEADRKYNTGNYRQATSFSRVLKEVGIHKFARKMLPKALFNLGREKLTQSVEKPKPDLEADDWQFVFLQKLYDTTCFQTRQYVENTYGVVWDYSRDPTKH